jgi:Do/DeqQ family serine protease
MSEFRRQITHALLLVAFAAAPRLAAQPLLNAGIESPFVAVAERVSPAVAAIRTTRAFTHGELQGENPMEEMFRRFFRPDSDFGEREFDMPGAGSGFVVSADGYVITNNHVVADATEISVSLPGFDTPLDAEIVGTDPATDLAVLKVDSRQKLPFLEFGDSDAIAVGAWAIAIGNPLGELAGSLTVGIVSAKGRTDLRIQGGTPRYQDFLQTDAAINFGNSGGPLVDIHGRVIGVNTAINAAGQNIGFAIPINLAARIYQQLVEYGRVSRGYLGVQMEAITPALAEARDLDIQWGVEVTDVLDDTPAAKAGIRRGDIIVEFGGHAIRNSNDLRFRVADSPVGRSAKVKLYRDGKQQTVDVVLAEFDENVAVAAAPQSEAGDARGERWLGVLAASLSDPSERVQSLIETFDIREEAGVVVVDVERGSPADRARLRPGDVIVEIVNVDIRDLADFQAARDQFAQRDKPIAVAIRRGTLFSYVTIDPSNSR